MITNRYIYHCPARGGNSYTLPEKEKEKEKGEEVRQPSFLRSKLIKTRVKATLHAPGDICNRK